MSTSLRTTSRRTRKNHNPVSNSKMQQEPRNRYYLSLDIETGGFDKPIFALGAAVFQINKKNEPVFLEELLLNFIMPETPDDVNFSKYFNESTFTGFWSKEENLSVLKSLNILHTNPSYKGKCCNEEELITKFYKWWVSITEKYKNIKIVTDAPQFDVGYVDKKIMEYLPLGQEKTRPLVFQWEEDGGYYDYVSTLDYNTFELVFEMNFPKQKAKEKLYRIIGPIPFEHDHNPLNDCKEQAYKFAKLYSFMKKAAYLLT